MEKIEYLLKKLQELEPEAGWKRERFNCLATNEPCMQAVVFKQEGVWEYFRDSAPPVRQTFECEEGVFRCVMYK